MQGPYTPNLGHFGAPPSNVMHPPISDFSETSDPLYGPPEPSGSEHAFTMEAEPPPALYVLSATTYPAAAATYAPKATTQPPLVGSYSGAHAPSASTSVVHPEHAPVVRHLSM